MRPNTMEKIGLDGFMDGVRVGLESVTSDCDSTFLEEWEGGGRDGPREGAEGVAIRRGEGLHKRCCDGISMDGG